MKKLYIALDGGKKLSVGEAQTFSSRVFKLRTVDINQFQAKISVGLLWDGVDYELHSTYLTNLKPAENGYSYLNCRLDVQGRSLVLTIKNQNKTVCRESFSTLPKEKLRTYILGGLAGFLLLCGLVTMLLLVDFSSLIFPDNTPLKQTPVKQNQNSLIEEGEKELVVVIEQQEMKTESEPIAEEALQVYIESVPEKKANIEQYSLEERRVYFSPNSAEITKTTEERLDKILTFLLEYPRLHVTITGHCAIAGTEVGRKEISVQRAENVNIWFRQKGWNPDNKPDIKGEAGNYPLTLDPDQQELNRRVDIGFYE